MEEEMIRDETVFVMGEEVARYNGAYKVCHKVKPAGAWLMCRSPRVC
jgi:pyruvate/2-oxoglutarate/acetoin dehydrogenase E1 component